MRTEEYNKKIKHEAFLLQDLKENRGWKDVLKPWIEEQVNINRDISKINTSNKEDIVKEYRIHRTKYDVYFGILQYIENKIQRAKALEGGKNGT